MLHDKTYDNLSIGPTGRHDVRELGHVLWRHCRKVWLTNKSTNGTRRNQGQRSDPARILKGNTLADTPAEGESDQMRLCYLECVEKAHGIVGQVRESVW